MNKPMSLVRQQGQYDCALACLSMMAGRPYDRLFNMDFRNKIEIATTCTDDDLLEAFKLAGFVKDVDTKTVYLGNTGTNVVRQLLWGRKAIIQLPSLNYDQSEHFIAWDGRAIFDPSNKQEYKFWQCVKPTLVILF